MTKAELKEALDLYFDDDEVVVCADESGGWDNITQVGRVGGTAAIYFGGGSPFSDE
jgi:hypothetical protein